MTGFIIGGSGKEGAGFCLVETAGKPFENVGIRPDAGRLFVYQTTSRPHPCLIFLLPVLTGRHVDGSDLPARPVPRPPAGE